jgi:peptidoglycan/LPS O-acetylase OafA/YrhL
MPSLLDRTRTGSRSDGIDSLRALLAIYVIFSHLYLWGPLTATGTVAPLSWFGHYTVAAFQGHGETNPAVVAFIVLSGYCIHRNGARRDRWDQRGYLIKRAFRIWPVYIAATLVGAALFEAARHSQASVTQAMSATGSISAGCMAAKLSGIAAVIPSAHLYGCTYQGNAPLVTVAAEISLYVVYGLAIWFLLRGTPGRLLAAVAAAATFACFALVLTTPMLEGWWFNGSLFGFLPLWWIGALLVGDVEQRPLLWLGAAAAGTWIAATAYLHGTSSLAVEELRLLAFGVVAGLGIRLLDHRVRHLPRPVTGVGRAGYSIYAFHAPILILLVASAFAGGSSLPQPSRQGVGSFYAFEHPLTQKGRELARRERDEDRAAVAKISDAPA